MKHSAPVLPFQKNPVAVSSLGARQEGHAAFARTVTPPGNAVPPLRRARSANSKPIWHLRAFYSPGLGTKPPAGPLDRS